MKPRALCYRHNLPHAQTPECCARRTDWAWLPSIVSPAVVCSTVGGWGTGVQTKVKENKRRAEFEEDESMDNFTSPQSNLQNMLLTDNVLTSISYQLPIPSQAQASTAHYTSPSLTSRARTLSKQHRPCIEIWNVQLHFHSRGKFFPVSQISNHV